MTALLRVELRWVLVLAVCQMGVARADAGSEGTRQSEGASLAGVPALPTMEYPPCWGEYCGYAPASFSGYGHTIWSDAPAAPVRQIWTFDYRVRQMFNSSTSYEFGNPAWAAPGPYAPLSRLDFALDSTWHGFQIGVELPDWHFHFEWLTPMQGRIDGDMADFDWNIDAPRDDPSRLDSFTLSSQRWCDGQVLELGTEFKLTNSFLGWPVELWPTAGFRFQRFDITAYNITQIVPALGPIAAYDGVDVLTFNQQYYVGYFGAQFHGTVRVGWIPIDVNFQVDGGPTAGYNIDHHLLRSGDRFTIEETHGGTWHVGVSAEAHLTERFSVGFQADHMQTRTSGSHRLLNEPEGYDLTWDNGVNVKSDQSTLTAFARYRF